MLARMESIRYQK